MIDKFNRKINYIRISVTDRCNLRCVYCMPKKGIKKINHKNVLSFEKIVEIVEKATNLGFDKIRLTGGEPLLRKNIVNLVMMLSKIKGIKDLAMTTNGTLLEKMASSLKKAGMLRLNISLDTMNPETFAKITRGGNLQDVINGIEKVQKLGFHPIKLNCVIKESIKEKDAKDVAFFARKKNLELRFIRRMNIKDGDFWTVIGGNGGNCKKCNRIRITSNGYILPCLFSDKSISIKKYNIENAIKLAVLEKPETGKKSLNNKFYTVGG